MSLSRKLLLRPDRRRRTPSRFSWLDQRLVRERHLRNLSPCASALYLFLSVVADANGVSWYSTQRIGLEINLSIEQLENARAQLVDADLVAWQDGVYQVLEVPQKTAPCKTTNSRPGMHRSGKNNQNQKAATSEEIHSVIEAWKKRAGYW